MSGIEIKQRRKDSTYVHYVLVNLLQVTFVVQERVHLLMAYLHCVEFPRFAFGFIEQVMGPFGV